MARGVGGGGGGFIINFEGWLLRCGNKVTDTLSTTSFKKNPRFHPISHHDDKI